MYSYYIPFIFLFVTFILSFQKKYYIVALVNLIASFMFLQLIQNPSIKIRYIDWILTTPLLLYELSIIQNITDIHTQIIIQISNLLMFFFGYLGEIYTKYRLLFCVLAFIPLCIIFYLLYVPTFFYFYFLVLWTAYGIVYLLPKKRSLLYNLLDIFSKSIFGLLYIYL
jgi:bacteriorhodopsin